VDLLLIDYSLPDMTGAPLVDELRGIGKLSPFVVITSHSDTEVAVRLMKLGALDHLIKDAQLLYLLPATTLRVLKEIATQRRLAAAEGALQENEQRYRQLLAPVTDYLYSVRIEDGRPTATSHGPGCKRVTGYTPEEYASDPLLWIDMVHPEDRAGVVEHAQAAPAGKGALRSNTASGTRTVPCAGCNARLCRDATRRAELWPLTG
jgi:CheY-like chemotaxis protein